MTDIVYIFYENKTGKIKKISRREKPKGWDNPDWGYLAVHPDETVQGLMDGSISITDFRMLEDKGKLSLGERVPLPDELNDWIGTAPISEGAIGKKEDATMTITKSDGFLHFHSTQFFANEIYLVNSHDHMLFQKMYVCVGEGNYNSQEIRIPEPFFIIADDANEDGGIISYSP